MPVLDWSESVKDEQQQPDKNKLQLIVRTPGTKLEILNTCKNLIAKNESALLKTISELEQVSWMHASTISKLWILYDDETHTMIHSKHTFIE